MTTHHRAWYEDGSPNRATRTMFVRCTARLPCCQAVAETTAGAWAASMDSEKQNTQGTPDEDEAADTASGGAPDAPDTTDDEDRPVDNPSGG